MKLHGLTLVCSHTDVDCDKPDEKSIVTYVSSIRKHIARIPAKASHVVIKGQTSIQTVTIEVHPRKSPLPPLPDERLMVTPQTIFVSTPKSMKKGTPAVAEIAISPVTKPDSHEMSRTLHGMTAITATATRVEDVSLVSDASFNSKSGVESRMSEMEKSDSFKVNVTFFYVFRDIRMLKWL